MDRLPITLATFVKNEQSSIRDTLESVIPVVSEIVVVDTGSTDSTVKFVKEYTNRVYHIPFTDFGNIRTITAHLASMPWVLMLDADERILPEDHHKFAGLINQPEGVQGNNMELDHEGNVIVDSYALPRKRWADTWMMKQLDKENWPDWQVRLFRNHKDKRIGFRRRVHETVYGCVKTVHSLEGPVIHHFQGVGDTIQEKKDRALLYKRLYDEDIKDGIKHSEPPVVPIDDF